MLKIKKKSIWWNLHKTVLMGEGFPSSHARSLSEEDGPVTCHWGEGWGRCTGEAVCCCFMPTSSSAAQLPCS